MISIQYHGRLGNNLFTLAVAAILSRLSGVPLHTPAAPFFPATTAFALPHLVGRDAVRTPPRHLDLARFARLAQECDVIVQGNFQEIAYLAPHKEYLQTLLAPAHGPSLETTPDDLVLHLRLGDYFEPHNVATFGYPLQVVLAKLTALRFARLIVLTDSPQHPFVAQLVAQFRAIVPARGIDHDWRTLYTAHRLMLTPSSFGWWPAWLGEASEIHLPVEQGFWTAANNFALLPEEARYLTY